jgi:hypothetical protein
MYDPYGGQTQDQQVSNGILDTGKDILTAPFRPSTYLTNYAINPWAYSHTKGIWTPFETKGSEWKKGFNAVKEAWKDKGAFSGIKTGIGKFGKLVSPFGNYRVGKEFLTTDYKKRVRGRMHTSRLYMVKANNIRMNIHNMEKMGIKGEEISSLREKFMHNFIMSKRMDIKVAKNLKLLRLQTFTKWGIRGAKAGSIIGATMFAWDIASIAAKPLGQALMTGINNVAMDYQQRFMPEMGGQLQLSYLTQTNATERQRAVAAISKSYINGRSAMGNESSLMHS